MDDAKTRSCVQDHADAVVRGDIEAVTNDFAEELRPMIRYTGDAGQVTIRSHWQEREGRPQIVAGEPVT